MANAKHAANSHTGRSGSPRKGPGTSAGRAKAGNPSLNGSLKTGTSRRSFRTAVADAGVKAAAGVAGWAIGLLERFGRDRNQAPAPKKATKQAAGSFIESAKTAIAMRMDRAKFKELDKLTVKAIKEAAALVQKDKLRDVVRGTTLPGHEKALLVRELQRGLREIRSTIREAASDDIMSPKERRDIADKIKAINELRERIETQHKAKLEEVRSSPRPTLWGDVCRPIRALVRLGASLRQTKDAKLFKEYEKLQLDLVKKTTRAINFSKFPREFVGIQVELLRKTNEKLTPLRDEVQRQIKQASGDGRLSKAEKKGLTAAIKDIKDLEEETTKLLEKAAERVRRYQALQELAATLSGKAKKAVDVALDGARSCLIRGNVEAAGIWLKEADKVLAASSGRSARSPRSASGARATP